jgi:hypothetical protein
MVDGAPAMGWAPGGKPKVVLTKVVLAQGVEP